MASRRYRADEVIPVLIEARTMVGDAIDSTALQTSEVAELLGRIDRATAVPAGATPADDVVDLLIELVLVVDALSTAVPPAPGPSLPPAALRITVRTLLDRLAAASPGRSVEVRVPPFAAVQCVEGPRHTRGTPANVIETDAWTWIRLASGTWHWDQAVACHAIKASGSRADLRAHLPVLAHY